MKIPERRIRLAGPVNFRDLGGYPVGDRRMVGWRRLFRSDSLGPVTPEDARMITEELGLATIIDLRSTGEVAREGRGALSDSPLDYHHLPILGAEIEGEALARLSLLAVYGDMLHASAVRVAEILQMVAETEGPVVFHCVAGKDRTGIVAAVLLALLGVDEEDIVADYVLTQEVMPVMLERFPRRARLTSAGPALPSSLARADEATMRHLLAVLRDTYGSAAGYLAAGGASEGTATSLRRRFLVPAE